MSVALKSCWWSCGRGSVVASRTRWKKGQPVCVCASAREERRGRRNRRRCPRRARNSSAEVWQISALRETANAFWRPHVDLGGHSRSRFLTLGALGRQNRLSGVASTLLRKNLHHPTLSLGINALRNSTMFAPPLNSERYLLKPNWFSGL